jgi:hypothetical protein
MMARRIDSLELRFHRCSVPSSQSTQAYRETLELLRGSGVTFITAARKSIDTNPEECIDEEEGTIQSLGVLHDKLAPDEFKTPFTRGGTADFAYLRDEAEISFGQGVLPFSEQQRDTVALALIDFGVDMYYRFRPVLGTCDQAGENFPSQRSLDRCELQYLYWANFFSPALVEKVGSDFLLRAPGWKKEELGDGGILYVTLKSFSAWHSSPSSEIVDYFRTRMPILRPYRAKRINID